MEDIWLSFAKRLHSIATTGISYTKNHYDRERFEEIQAICSQMMALIGQVPIERIDALISAQAKGYVTPTIDVRGAVFRDDKILLVREKTDGRWTLPGGFADVGLSAAENICKEIAEEAGIAASAHLLYSIRHKAKGDYDPDVRDFYKLFFLCEPADDRDPEPGPETSDARFFARAEIPPLSTGRVIEEDLDMAWTFKSQSLSKTSFD